MMISSTKTERTTKPGCIIVHYDEIGLKGKNRNHFESILMKNIKQKLGDDITSTIRESGQIILELRKEKVSGSIIESLKKIPGIAFFSVAKKTSSDIETIKKDMIDELKGKEFNSFKINSKRRDKNYKPDSMELNKILGQAVVDILDKKVDIRNPDLMVKIEVSLKTAYISFEDIHGIGGLPTNPKQKVITLLSGGFDSPVASFLMMKRGCEVIFVHFQNTNQITKSVENKIIDLAKQLSKFQLYTKLYIIPFDDIQKQIIMNISSEQRMLIYRRYMIKISSKIAAQEKAKFLVVGDSLSQVASQTLDNLEATYTDSPTHIISPLIGMNKNEIIEISREIGTYDISSQPYGDCCSYFLAKHPELKANLQQLKKAEESLDIGNLISESIKKAKIKVY